MGCHLDTVRYLVGEKVSSSQGTQLMPSIAGGMNELMACTLGLAAPAVSPISKRPTYMGTARSVEGSVIGRRRRADTSQLPSKNKRTRLVPRNSRRRARLRARPNLPNQDYRRVFQDMQRIGRVFQEAGPQWCGQPGFRALSICVDFERVVSVGLISDLFVTCPVGVFVTCPVGARPFVRLQ